MDKITVESRIIECLSKMVFRDSYWGYLFSRIKRTLTEEIPSPFGVGIDKDGTLNLYYNPKFIDLISDDIIEKSLEHEGFHILNKHLIRMFKIMEEFNKNRWKDINELWNISSDMAANYLCKAPKTIKIGDTWAKLIHASDYGLQNGLSSESYFNTLFTQSQNQQNTQSQKENGKENKNQCNQDQQNNENNQDQKKNKDKSDVEKFSDHSMWKVNSEDDSSSFIYNKAEKEIQDLIYNSFKSMRNKGNLPSDLQNLIDEALKPPKVPYYYIIKKLINACRYGKIQKAYCKVNRKRLYSFYLEDENMLLPFPGNRKDMTFSIGIIIDTSGSMDENKIMEGLSGVKNIIENDKECKNIIIECDCIVQKEYSIKKVSDIQFNIKGRGGTILLPALERSKELDCDVTLIFTDAECDNINSYDRTKIPRKIIWVVPENADISMIDKVGYIVRVEM